MANEKEILEKIWKEIKRLADMAEESMEQYKKEREKAIPVAKKLDFWEEVRMWLDSVFQEAIMQIIRESVPKMRESREEMYRVMHEVAETIRVKRKIMQYLSEGGILKLDEELSKMKKEEEKHRKNAVQKVMNMEVSEE